MLLPRQNQHSNEGPVYAVLRQQQIRRNQKGQVGDQPDGPVYVGHEYLKPTSPSPDYGKRRRKEKIIKGVPSCTGSYSLARGRNDPDGSPAGQTWTACPVSCRKSERDWPSSKEG